MMVDTDGRLSGTGNVKNEDPKRSEIQNRKAGKSVIHGQRGNQGLT
jgi:hypothetical protein